MDYSSLFLIQESRPTELPPRPLAERYVNLSAYTAPIRQTHLPYPYASVQTSSAGSLKSCQRVLPFSFSGRLFGHDKWFCSHQYFLLIMFLQLDQVNIHESHLTQPPRSTPITGASSLLRAAPPQCAALVLCPLWYRHLGVSLCICTTGSRSSTEKPKTDSCCLHAGHHLHSIRSTLVD